MSTAASTPAAAGFSLALAAAALTACTSINATNATFEGTEWRIVAVNGVPAPSYPVRFERGFMTGVICNRFRAPYTVERVFLHLGGMENTERGCFDATGQFEQSAFAILRRRPLQLTWRSARRLTLSNAAGTIALERTGAPR